MKLVLVGISHHRTPIELREQVALSSGQAAALSRELAEGGGEAVCLSTCNRTELYVVGDGRRARARSRRSPTRRTRTPTGCTTRRPRCTCSASPRGSTRSFPGEGEILGQVRGAYEAGAPGPLLDRLFRQALHAGKKVRAQTAIAESPASVSAAAAALAQQVFGDLAGHRILVVGAGKVSEQAARNLISRGASIGFVANRSLDHGAELAGRIGAEALPLERIGEELVARRRRRLLDERARVRDLGARTSPPRFRRERAGRSLLIDLAVPRDLEPAIHELDDCYLYDIDDLESVVAETMAARRGEAEHAEAIVLAEAEEFRAWQASLDVVPAIASLRARAEEIRSARAQQGARRACPRASCEAVDSITAQILNKLLHLPTVRMKEAAAASDGLVYADAVRHLFGLGEEQE